MSQPARSIPGFRYEIPDAEIDWVLGEFRSVLDRREFLTAGAHCEAFEREFADYAGRRHAITMSSGTAALETILRAIDVSDRDVIVPTNTFAATAFAVIHAGGIPVFVDVLPDMTIDPDATAGALGNGTAAIVTVHVGGRISPATERLRSLADGAGIPLVEDAAHAHGSRHRGVHAGGFGIAGAFSFFSTKMITTGEGGMIVTDDDDIDAAARLIRDQAKEAGRNVHMIVGHNWRMTEFQAILGRSQLRTLDESIRKRGEIAQLYDRCLASSDIEVLPAEPESQPNHYKYVLFVPAGHDRDEYVRELKREHGITAGGYVYDVPCHRQPVFASHRFEACPVAEDIAARHVCPPIFASLSQDDASYVASSLIRAL